MTREELEHLIRACAEVTQHYEFVILGSQSILGPLPNAEADFTMSAEVDIYPLQAPELADAIDGAQGVGPETAVLPSDWMTRVHRVQSAATNDRVGYCLDVVDLFLAKAAAARDKDRVFCMALMRHGHVDLERAMDLVPKMPLDDAGQNRLRATLKRWRKALV
jgi:hypothetical protein